MTPWATVSRLDGLPQGSSSSSFLCPKTRFISKKSPLVSERTFAFHIPAITSPKVMLEEW